MSTRSNHVAVFVVAQKVFEFTIRRKFTHSVELAEELGCSVRQARRFLHAMHEARPHVFSIRREKLDDKAGRAWVVLETNQTYRKEHRYL